VVYGEHVKRYLISEGVESTKIFVANHSVDNGFYSQSIPETEKDKLLELLNIPLSDKIVLFLGRLEKNKGVENLLLAFSKMIQAEQESERIILIIAGTGSDKENLESLSSKLGLVNRVIFTGYIPVTQAVKYYSIASIFVLPSITTDQIKETWGLVINEAMNQSVPVIASDSVGAGAGGLIENGINGIIYPEENIQKLYESLRYLLGNKEIRIKMGENGRKRVAEWNYDKMSEGFVRAINFVKEKSQNE
jgi:glycosyltransferase involved in cell wall biosynthesis